MPEVFSMPNYLNEAEAWIKASIAVNKELEPLSEIKNQMMPDPSSHRYKFDHRDMLPMSLLIPPGNDRDDKIREMINSFVSDDPQRIKPWLDMLYDSRDNTPLDFSNLNMNDPEEVKAMVRLSTNCQTYGTMSTAYPEHFAARYNDPQEMAKMKAHNNCLGDIGGVHSTILMTKDLKMGVAMTLGATPLGAAGEQIKLDAHMREYKFLTENKLYDTIPFRASPHFTKVVNADIDRVRTLGNDQPSFAIEDEIKNTFETTRKNAQQMGVQMNDLIFINGKSVSEMVSERKPPIAGARDMADAGLAIIATAMASGKHRIHTTELAKDQEGQLTPRLVEVKPDLKGMGNTAKYDYHPIRVALFNWGPFKCKTRDDMSNELHAKPIPVEMQAKLDGKIAAIANGPVRDVNQRQAAERVRQAPAPAKVAEKKLEMTPQLEQYLKEQQEAEIRKAEGAQKVAEAKRLREQQVKQPSAEEKAKEEMLKINPKLEEYMKEQQEAELRKAEGAKRVAEAKRLREQQVKQPSAEEKAKEEMLKINPKLEEYMKQQQEAELRKAEGAKMVAEAKRLREAQKVVSPNNPFGFLLENKAQETAREKVTVESLNKEQNKNTPKAEQKLTKVQPTNTPKAMEAPKM